MVPFIERLLAAPPAEVTELLLTTPEGQWFDRKSARIAARDLGKTLVAMANAEGGVIAIGLADGRCEGVDDRPSAHNQWRQAGVDHTQPPVRFDVLLLPCVNHRQTEDHLFVIPCRRETSPHDYPGRCLSARRRRRPEAVLQAACGTAL